MRLGSQGIARITVDDSTWKLRDAIIIRASDDYRSVYKKVVIKREELKKVMKEDNFLELAAWHRKHGKDYKSCVIDERRERKFFFSEYYGMLTDIDGSYLVKHLRKDVEEKYEKAQEED